MKLYSLDLTRTVKVAGGEMKIEGQFHDLKENEGIDAVAMIEGLAAFAIREAFEKISSTAETTQHPSPLPGAAFDEVPAPESRPENAPQEVPVAAEPEPAPAEKAFTCSRCGGPATKNDKSISAEFLPKDMAGKIFCSKCFNQFKKDQLEWKKPEEVPDKTPVAEPEPEKPAARLTCEGCGAPIDTNTAKLSDIFVGKKLCKKCLEEVQK